MRVMHVRRDCSEVLNDLLRVLRLSRTGLACDEDTLVLSLLTHVHPRAFGDCEYVGWILIATLASVLVHDGFRVEG